MIRITVPGKPVGKGRPRFVRATGRAYTPARTESYEARIAFFATEVMGGGAPFDEPVQVKITSFAPIPPSWSKRRQRLALEGLVRPGRPDLDNILKVIGDSLNSVCWADDSLIAEVSVSKLYDDGIGPRLEIQVAPLSAQREFEAK